MSLHPKRLSLRPRHVEAEMFLKLNMSLIPNNLVDVVESPIWEQLYSISSRIAK